MNSRRLKSGINPATEIEPLGETLKNQVKGIPAYTWKLRRRQARMNEGRKGPTTTRTEKTEVAKTNRLSSNPELNTIPPMLGCTVKVIDQRVLARRE